MSSADLDLIADALPLMLARCGRDLRYRFANRAAAIFHGLEPAQMSGMPIEHVLGDEAFAALCPYLERVLGGEAIEFETRLPFAVAGPRTVRIKLTPDRDGDGTVTGWIEATADVTQQRDREQWLQLLWEAAAVLLKAEDPDSMLRGLFEKISRQLDVDTYFNFMVETPDEELRLVSCAGITEGQKRQIERLRFGQAICGTVAKQRHPIVATDIQSSDDEKVQLVRSYGIRAYACNPLMADGNLLGTLSFARRNRDHFDQEEIEFIETITRYVSAAYERLQLIEQLRAADRRKDEFLAMVSHELRTPLASGYGWVQFLEQPQEEDVTATGMRAIKDSFVAQIALVDDLLDVSRIAAGKLELRTGAVDLAEIVHDACENIRASAAEKDITLSVSLQPRIAVRGDAPRLRQVAMNLLTNAVRFTPNGGKVTVELQHLATEAELVVSDTGVGIEPAFLPHVFDAFRQGGDALTREHGGLGLGLSIVNSLVTAHGGVVHAESDGPGHGAKFNVRLPLTDEPLAAPGEGRPNAPRLHLLKNNFTR